MEEPPTPALNSSTFREATFPKSLLGYDQNAVHAFLDQVADWVEQNAGVPGVPAREELTSEFAKVGERTSGILAAAEEAAVKLRADAREYAERIRAEAEQDARMTMLDASQKADELVAGAEEKAERIIEEAVLRRRGLNQAVGSLAERRDAVATDARRLAEELLAAVEGIQDPAPAGDEPVEGEPQPLEPTEFVDAEVESDDLAFEEPPAEPEPPADEEPPADDEEPPADAEPPDERDTAVHETR
jgi:DivIVA domain-containing protein